MNTPIQDPIAHACRLLREAAEELKSGHTLAKTGHDWTGEPEAKAAYDEHRAVADALERWESAIGAGGVEPLRSRQCLHQIAAPAQAAGEYPALSGRTVDELGESQRQAAIAAYRAAHGNDPDFGFAPDRAWIEGAAYVDADRAMRAQPGAAYAELPALFREALAWGMTYGPEIPAHQWDEMRESMVKHYTDRASRGQAPAPAAVAEPSELQAEAAKLAPILHSMVEGGGTDGETDIYADDYGPPDGDVYVYRAAEVLAALAATPATQSAQPPRTTGWLAWGGTAAPPVSGETLVEVKSHDLEPSGPLPARDWDWTLVAAYRLAPKVAPAAVAGPSDEQISNALRAAGFFDTKQSRRDMTAALMAALAAAPTAQPSPVAQGDALDAARYRWLRDPASNVALVLDKRTGYVPADERLPGVGGYHTYEYRAGEELDAAIDAARARLGEKGDSHG